MSEWREVGAHPKYSVSTDGQVRNNKTGRILKQFLGGTKRAYLCVSLDGKKRGVHTLVAEAFLPHEDYQTYVVHKDKNPKNNHVENLMWKKDHYHVHPNKGEWLHIEGDDDTYICPFCKTATYCEGDYVPKFCMECGADMRVSGDTE